MILVRTRFFPKVEMHKRRTTEEAFSARRTARIVCRNRILPLVCTSKIPLLRLCRRLHKLLRAFLSHPNIALGASSDISKIDSI
jgi:hypothetical protein